MTSRLVQCAVYLVASVMLGYYTLGSIAVGVWGVPVRFRSYLALLGAFGLLVSSLASLRNETWGRRSAIVSLGAMGALWFGGITELVPQHNINVPLWGYFVVLGYFSVVAFALLYPIQWPLSRLALFAILGGATLLASITAVRRFQRGEYAYPSFAYFRWTAGADGTLSVQGDPQDWVDDDAEHLLQRAGISGTLEWVGSSGERQATHRVIVLAQQAPRTYDLYFPRTGVLIYVFDGVTWRTVPSDALTYPSYATLETKDSTTMLWQSVGGGRSGGAAFRW